jgi:hypothetical protein
MTIRPLTITLLLVSLTLILIVAVPKWRLNLRDRLLPNARTLVAKVDGQLSADGPSIIVLKIKTRDQYFLEVYRSNENLELMQRIALEEPLDGRFSFQGRFTNLAMVDINNDGVFEVVSPMFDKNSVPRLLIFKYNSVLQSFEKLTAE